MFLMFNWSLFSISVFSIMLKIWECAFLDLRLSNVSKNCLPKQNANFWGSLLLSLHKKSSVHLTQLQNFRFKILLFQSSCLMEAKMVIVSTLFIWYIVVTTVILSSFDFLPIKISFFNSLLYWNVIIMVKW